MGPRHRFANLSIYSCLSKESRSTFSSQSPKLELWTLFRLDNYFVYYDGFSSLVEGFWVVVPGSSVLRPTPTCPAPPVRPTEDVRSLSPGRGLRRGERTTLPGPRGPPRLKTFRRGRPRKGRWSATDVSRDGTKKVCLHSRPSSDTVECGGDYERRD